MKHLSKVKNLILDTNKQKFKAKLKDKTYVSAFVLLAATVFANFLNFAFNAYLGRVLGFEDLALIGLFGSLLYFSFIPNSALGSTVNYRSSFLEGKFGEKISRYFWKTVRLKSFFIACAVSILWVLVSPLFMDYFRVEAFLPLLVFTPIIFFGLISSVDRGYLNARFAFFFLAVITIFEPLVKLVFAYGLVQSGNASLSYLSIPISVVLVFVLISIYFFLDRKDHTPHKSVKKFPGRFFVASLITNLSTIAFLSFDIVLAKHFLPAEQAGQYALLSLVGKMVYFLGSLGTQFLTPFASRREGAGKDSKSVLYISLLLSALFSFVGLVTFGFFGKTTIPFLFGEKAFVILPYVLPICFALFCFAISRGFAGYHLIKKSYIFPLVAMAMSALQFLLIQFNHSTVGSIVWAMVITGFSTLVIMATLHRFAGRVKVVEENIRDFFLVFSKNEEFASSDKQNILVFNWRDIRHVWAGGAEVYVHELMKRWVASGNKVTLFCGNDGHSKSDEIIDGIHVYRRGGFYTVYLWAFIYYVLRFRRRYDVVVDSVNGIPFFTPLFSSKKVVAVIPHVHQEVFRKHLRFPFSYVAMYLEAKLMPLVYKNSQIVTVSSSSKEEIIKLGFNAEKISIINPGIERIALEKNTKSQAPLIAYLGRLKPYKNIDIGIKAFAHVLKVHPEARMVIAGEGESLTDLQNLAKDLRIEKSIFFAGKVSDFQKAQIFANAWMAFQLSQVEGWGITVIEANAYATPVVASRVNGLKDSILDGKTGILVPFKNVGATADAMIDLIEDDAFRSALAKNALQWSQQFNWDDGAVVFTQILKEGRSRTYPAKILGNLGFARKIISVFF